MLKKFLSNCKKPQGKFGKMVAKAMNKGHARLWNWANEIITIEDGEKFWMLDAAEEEICCVCFGNSQTARLTE